MNRLSSIPATGRVSEYPAVNEAIALLERLMTSGILDAGEASDLSDRVWDCHYPSSALTIVQNYVVIKGLLTEEKISKELAERLYKKNLDRPVGVQIELDIFEQLLSADIPDELADNMKNLMPSATKRVLKAMIYVRTMIQELMDAGIIDQSHKETLESRHPTLAEQELRLSIPKDSNIQNPEQAQAIRKKLLYWLEPSGWPESEIQKSE